MSAASVAIRAELIGALHRALTIAVETGRTQGDEFEHVVTLIRHRDNVIFDEKRSEFIDSLIDRTTNDIQTP